MNRPLAGVVLLVLTVVAVTVVPMINGRRVAGSGTAVEFPAPPQVGDCVVPPFPADNVVDRLDPEVRVTAIKFGPCTGAKFGEVVALSDADTIGRESSRIPSRGVCSRQIAEYAGLTTSPGSVALPGESTSGPMAWMPTIGSESYLIVPSLREQSAGHNWVACLAAATNQHSYQGSLRAAYTTGALPDQFGLCWTGADLDLIPGLLACDQPHAAELLATGWIGDRSQMPQIGHRRRLPSDRRADHAHRRPHPGRRDHRRARSRPARWRVQTDRPAHGRLSGHRLGHGATDRHRHRVGRSSRAGHQIDILGSVS